MKIKYLGHSSFALTSDAGTIIVTDPYDGSIGFDMPCVEAHLVTLSHHHYDHANYGAVGGSPALLDRAQNGAFRDIEIRGVNSFHDDMQGAQRGENVIFVFTVDGMKICHLGDLGESVSQELIGRIGAVDILLVPVGGRYTIDASEAKKYVAAINPKVVIPMHFKTEDLTLDISGVEPFLRLFGGVEIRSASSEISLSQGDICGSKCKIIVMERAYNG